MGSNKRCVNCGHGSKMHRLKNGVWSCVDIDRDILLQADIHCPCSTFQPEADQFDAGSKES